MSPEHDIDRTRPFRLVTCEHGGCEVPPEHAALFSGASAALQSHRGSDIGALGVALEMSSRLHAPLIASRITRLLVDLNRSLDNPGLLSEFSRVLPDAEIARVVESHYRPHRECVAGTVAAAVRAGRRVIHVGVHSFTDVLDGTSRDLDVGLLFDDTRPLELGLCDRWRRDLSIRAAGHRCRFNEPYHGRDDGLTTTLRAGFDPDTYLGIEVEIVNARIRTPSAQIGYGRLLAESLTAVLAG